MIQKIKEAWGDQCAMIKWSDFVGCECDAVVYISSGDGARAANNVTAQFFGVGAADSGYHEAMSRSRYFLGIITVVKDAKTRSSYEKLAKQLG